MVAADRMATLESAGATGGVAGEGGQPPKAPDSGTGATLSQMGTHPAHVLTVCVAAAKGMWVWWEAFDCWPPLTSL